MPTLKTPSNDFCKEHKTFIETIAASCAKRYPKNSRWDKYELESVAWIAFLNSYNSFNEEHNVPFKAYAAQNIIKEIHHFISVNMFAVKTNYNNIKNDVDKLSQVISIERGLKDINHSIDNDTHAPQDNIPTSGYGTINTIIEKDTKDFIQSKLKNLSPIQKQIIKMRFVQDMSFENIGKTLGCSKGHILYQHNVALNILKDRLKDVNDCN